MWGPFFAHPGRAAIFSDFDGTLAPIVDDPMASQALPGAVTTLTRLAARFGRVGIISGRPVDFLAHRLGRGGGLYLSGLYGLEAIDAGQRLERAEAFAWRPLMAAIVVAANAAWGPIVEDKDLSLTLHFRSDPDRAPAVRAWAASVAARNGLVVRSAKASVELHPRIGADKGTVVEALAEGMAAACFMGDDVGDLPAFSALDRLSKQGMHTVKVAVSTSETPPEILDRADVVVEGPEGALVLLESLCGS